MNAKICAKLINGKDAMHVDDVSDGFGSGRIIDDVLESLAYIVDFDRLTYAQKKQLTKHHSKQVAAN